MEDRYWKSFTETGSVTTIFITEGNGHLPTGNRTPGGG